MENKILNPESEKPYKETIKHLTYLFSKNNFNYEDTAFIIQAVRKKLKLKKNKQQNNVVAILSQSQVEDLLNYAHKTNTFKSLILKTLFFTGVRANELVNLEVKDIYYDEGFLRIREGKGGKSRDIPLYKPLRDELYVYLNGRKNGYLFYSNRREKLSTVRIWQIVKEIARDAGIIVLSKEKSYKYKTLSGIRIYPHLYRHTIATYLINHGMKINEVQLFLGHSNPQTTEIYAKTMPKTIKESYTKALEYKD